jgi:hypothetical protein
LIAFRASANELPIGESGGRQHERYVYIYIYIYIQTYIYMCLYFYFRINKSMCICMYTEQHERCVYISILYIKVYVFTNICIHISIYIYIHIHLCIYIHINMNAYKYIYIYICKYIYRFLRAVETLDSVAGRTERALLGVYSCFCLSIFVLHVLLCFCLFWLVRILHMKNSFIARCYWILFGISLYLSFLWYCTCFLQNDRIYMYF